MKPISISSAAAAVLFASLRLFLSAATIEAFSTSTSTFTGSTSKKGLRTAGSTTTSTTTSRSSPLLFYQLNSEADYSYRPQPQPQPQEQQQQAQAQNIRSIQADQQTASLQPMNNFRSKGGQMVPRNTNGSIMQQQQQQQQQPFQPQMPDQQTYQNPTDRTLVVAVQGGSLRTFRNEPSPILETGQSGIDGSFHHHHIHMQSEGEGGGRPIDATYELWEGPDHTPTRMRLYSEDAQLRPFHAIVENRGRRSNPSSTSSYGNGYGYNPGNVMSIRNTGPMEFPLVTIVSRQPSQPQPQQHSMVSSTTPTTTTTTTTVQGGALRTWSFDHSVGSVQVRLTTESGLPMYALVEHWGVDGHVKQIAELYHDNGAQRPFVCTIQTPGGSGDTIAIGNTGPLEYPLQANVQPMTMSSMENNAYYGGGGSSGNSYYGHNSRYTTTSMSTSMPMQNNRGGGGYTNGLFPAWI